MRYVAAALVAALLAITLSITFSLAGPSDAPEAEAATASVTPDRVLDTREGLGAPDRRVRPSEVVRLVMPPTASTSNAVAFNLTATDAAAPGFVTAWPCGEPPETSNLNVFPGVVSTNLAVVGMTAGAVCLSSSVEVNLIADVMGTLAGATDYRAAAPTRLLDTRDGGPRLRSGDDRRVPLTAGDGYTSGAGGVALNVTVVNPDADGFVTIYPCGNRPLASTVNFRRRDIVPNFTIVTYTGGEVCAYASTGTDLVVDSFGWSSNAGDLRLGSPSRILDTRTDLGWSGDPPSPNTTVELRVAGIGSVPLDAQGVLMTLVATDASADGFVTIYPCDEARPSTSILNLRNGAIRANLAFVPLSATDGEICLWAYTTNGSSVGLVGDVVGWTLGGPDRAPAPIPPPVTTTPGTPTTTTSTTVPSPPPSGSFVERFDTLDRWVFAHRRYEPPVNSDAPSTATIVNGQAQIYGADQNYGDATLRSIVPYNLTGGGTVTLDISDNVGGWLLLGEPYVMFSAQTWDAAAQMGGERDEPYAPAAMPTEGVTVRLGTNCRVPWGPPVVVAYNPAAPNGRTVQGGECSATPDGKLRLVYTPGNLSIRNGANAEIVAYPVTIPPVGHLMLGVHNHASLKYDEGPGPMPAVIGMFDNVIYPT